MVLSMVCSDPFLIAYSLVFHYVTVGMNACRCLRAANRQELCDSRSGRLQLQGQHD
jgi:hypothetical protein